MPEKVTSHEELNQKPKGLLKDKYDPDNPYNFKSADLSKNALHKPLGLILVQKNPPITLRVLSILERNPFFYYLGLTPELMSRIGCCERNWNFDLGELWQYIRKHQNDYQELFFSQIAPLVSSNLERQLRCDPCEIEYNVKKIKTMVCNMDNLDPFFNPCYNHGGHHGV